MRPVPASASSALRTWTRHSLPTHSTSTSPIKTVQLAGVTASNLPQRRSQTGSASGTESASFESPFSRAAAKEKKYDTHKIPSFKNYASGSSEISNRVFQYFMAGSMGLLAAAGAKNTVQGELLKWLNAALKRQSWDWEMQKNGPAAKYAPNCSTDIPVSFLQTS